MAPTAETYREMLCRDMSVFKLVDARDEVLTCLQDNWSAALDDTRASSWSGENRAAILVWAGIGFFVYGDSTRIGEALRILVERPQVADRKLCRYYICAIQHLLPVPSEWSVLDEPKRFLEWFVQYRDKIAWNERKGRYELNERPEN
jgi:hypothetical protein